MKVSITFKTPDAVQNALDGMRATLQREAVENEIPDDEQDDWVEEKLEDFEKKFEKWIRYGELITVEFDLENDTATVAGK